MLRIFTSPFGDSRIAMILKLIRSIESAPSPTKVKVLKNPMDAFCDEEKLYYARYGTIPTIR